MLAAPFHPIVLLLHLVVKKWDLQQSQINWGTRGWGGGWMAQESRRPVLGSGKADRTDNEVGRFEFV